METTTLSVTQETPSVFTYRFVKPPGFLYKAGQFINIEIPVENPDNRGSKRNSSLASSPTEDFLMISMRRGVSQFKKTLEQIKIGAPVKIVGPLGRFTLNEDETTPAVMLTGGIGITPFRSMIKYATDKKLKKHITLIYSNKTASDIPFQQELFALHAKNEHLTIYHTVTQDESWTGKKGRISEELIRECVPSLEKAEYYICGSPQMVTSLRALLATMQIPSERIAFEPFTGY